MKKIILLIISVLVSTSLFAKEPPKPRKVYFASSLPFAAKGADQKLHGFDIDLWREIAKEMGWRENIDYKIELTSSFREVFHKVEQQDGDIALAGITITQDREKRFDFTYPYMDSGLTIAIPTVSGSTGATSSIFNALTSSSVIEMLLIFSLIILAAAHIIWIAEQGSEEISDKYWSGIWDGIWWSIVTATTVGYGDKVPHKKVSKIVAIVVMFVGIISFGFFTAELASNMTAKKMNAIEGLEDIKPTTRVGTVQDSTSEQFLLSYQGESGILKEYKNVTEATDALKRKKVDCVIYDAPMLQYIAKKNSDSITTVDKKFDLQKYGILLKLGSIERKKINDALLGLQKSGRLSELKNRYFN